jgi:SAM-dependent methyltransferase
MNPIEGFLGRGDRVLDLGAGTCHVCDALRKQGIDVTPVDVRDRSYFPQISPILYDGVRIPFPDGHFDVTLILTVLHHTRNQEEIIREAMRVSRRLIIIEDVYVNFFDKYLTFLFDSIGNLEFRGHPHANRTEEEWCSLFGGLGLHVKEMKSQRADLVFRQRLFLLEKTGWA